MLVTDCCVPGMQAGLRAMGARALIREKAGLINSSFFTYLFIPVCMCVCLCGCFMVEALASLKSNVLEIFGWRET